VRNNKPTIDRQSRDSDSYSILDLDTPKKIANAELRLKNEEETYNYLIALLACLPQAGY
jgi:hypothetical protein